MKSNLDIALSHKMTRLSEVMEDPQSAKLFELAYRLGYRAGVQYGSFVQGAVDKSLVDPVRSKESIRYIDYLMDCTEDLPYPRFLALSGALRVARVMSRVRGLAVDYRKIRSLPQPEKNDDVIDEIVRPKDGFVLEVL